mgnify:CR=1 FL=1
MCITGSSIWADQKQSVAILYMLSVVLGLSAVVLATSGEVKIIILAVAILASVLIGLSVTGHDKKKEKEQREEKQDEGTEDAPGSEEKHG